jgi:hypothetical protein
VAHEFTKFSKLLKLRGYPTGFAHSALRKFLKKEFESREDPDYRIILDYCENMDQDHLARYLRLLEPNKVIQVAWRMLPSVGMKTTKATRSIYFSSKDGPQQM